jgi:hypothetical protein
LIELSADRTLQLEFSSEEFDTFWLVRRNEYPELVTETLKILIPFATLYLCKIGFSSRAAMKTKQRNGLSLENDLFYVSVIWNDAVKYLINYVHFL